MTINFFLSGNFVNTFYEYSSSMFPTEDPKPKSLPSIVGHYV